MKKLFFCLLFLCSLNSLFSQTDKRKIACYTTTCCEAFGVGINIVSLTHCHYVYTTPKNGNSLDGYTSTLNLNDSKQVLNQNTTIAKDIIMPQYNKSDNEIAYIPQGNYLITNNEINYNVSFTDRIRKACWSERVTGQVFGHDVDYTVTVCAYYWSFSNKNASLSITPMFSKGQLEEIRNNNNLFNVSRDITLKNGDISYTLKSGDYYLNDDGSIYLINTVLN